MDNSELDKDEDGKVCLFFLIRIKKGYLKKLYRTLGYGCMKC